MFKLILTSAFSVLTFLAQPAAAGIPVGYSEFEDFILEFPDGADDVLGPGASLCHLVRKYHFAYIPVFYLSEGYVIGQNRCQEDSFYRLTEDQSSSLRSLGLLPPNTPAAPSLTMTQQSPPLLWGAAIGLIVLAYWLSGRRQNARFARMGALSPETKQILDTLCHAAQAAERTDPGSLVFIAAITEKMTSEHVLATTVNQAVAASARKPNRIDMSRFGKDFTVQQRNLLLQAAILLVASDGTVSPKGRRFLLALAKAFRFKTRAIKTTLRDIAKQAKANQRTPARP